MSPIPMAIMYIGNTSLSGIRCLKKRYAAMPNVVVKKLAITSLYGLMMQAISIPKPKIITPIGYSLVLGCISHVASKHTMPRMSNTYACVRFLLRDIAPEEICFSMDDQILDS